VKGVRSKRVVAEMRAHRSHNCCVFCGMKVSMLPADREEFTIRGEEDRIVPATQGGRYTVTSELPDGPYGAGARGNLQIACRVCNAQRGDMTIAEFIAKYGS
jgi:5-methylcytosine-specific restriction endonuclease McrA